MTLSRFTKSALGGLALTALAASAAYAGDAPVANKGDTAWMLISTALVLMMSIPGLALFYGGLVRSKNMLSIMAQVFAIVALVGVIWVVYGYSLAFTNGGGLNAYVGGLSKAFLMGVTPDSTAATFSNGVVIPELVYMVFQMTFAMITPALIIGAIAERVRFSALIVFVVLWVTVIYFPIAHMVWYWAGPDALVMLQKPWPQRLMMQRKLQRKPISMPSPRMRVSFSNGVRLILPAALLFTSMPVLRALLVLSSSASAQAMAKNSWHRIRSQ